MALITHPRTLIEVPLTDRVFDDTTIKQDAIFIGLRHDQNHDTGVGIVSITVLVKSFASDNGAKGIYLGDKGMYDKRIDLVADNDTIVNAATGEILAIRTRMMTPNDWQSIIDALTVDYAYQGDFFIQLREAAPIVIGDMIRQHIAQADAMGKFA